MRATRVGPQGGICGYSSPIPQELCPTYSGQYPPQGNELFPSFWLPFRDLGSGVVDTAEYRTNATPTFTRATTAWTRLSTGLWASIASGSPRSYYDENLVYRGFFCEAGTTNRCFQSRDLTQAVWVSGGGGITPLKNITGIDGSANSASRITAGGVDGTLLQSITSASAVRTFSCYMKRITGTGAVSITLDNGTAWTDVSSLINSSTWTRVQVKQTVTNPIVGFKITTSGDAVAVDMCQEETTGAGTNGVASSPYPAGAVNAVRNTDALTYTIGWFNATEGTFYTEYTPIQSPGTSSCDLLLAQTDANNTIDFIHSSAGSGPAGLTVVNASVTQVSSTTGNAFTSGTRGKAAAYYKANDCGVVLNAGTIAADTSATLPAVTSFRVGGGRAGSAYGSFMNSKYYNRRLSDSQLQALTA